MKDALRITAEILRRLQPIGAMSDARLTELASLTFVEKVSRTLDPFRLRPAEGTSVYLLSGELALNLPDGGLSVVVGGSDDAVHALGRAAPFTDARAITDVELVRFDDELLDIMMTWDQLAQAESTPSAAANDARAEPALQATEWHLLTGLFSVNNLRTGALSRLPAANIGRLLKCFERVPVKRGVRVVSEGEAGDYYYVIESGRAEVVRQVGGVAMKIAHLTTRDAFGEEALLADGLRNASVVMLADGSLLRLAKAHFVELLKAPLLREVDPGAARGIVARGGRWIDVRYPSEFQYDHFPDALNIPLGEVRNAITLLDPAREYVVYCQTGRRSSAAAFLLAQRGINASVLAGGMSQAARTSAHP